MPDVICPHCTQSWLKTTDAFDPDKTINAAMFRLKKQYRDEGQGFCGVHQDSITDSIEGYAVQYPCCGNFMCDGNYRFNGKIEDVEEKPKPKKKKYVCGCGAEFDYPIALFNHRKKCEKGGK